VTEGAKALLSRGRDQARPSTAIAKMLVTLIRSCVEKSSLAEVINQELFQVEPSVTPD
jgi:hypothetical protein